jgi:hypothetical protein
VVHWDSRRNAVVAEFTAPNFALAPSQKAATSLPPTTNSFPLPNLLLSITTSTPSPLHHQNPLPNTFLVLKAHLTSYFCPWKHLHAPFLIFDCTSLATSSDHVLESSRAVLAPSNTRLIFPWNSIHRKSAFIVGLPYDCGLQLLP